MSFWRLMAGMARLPFASCFEWTIDSEPIPLWLEPKRPYQEGYDEASNNDEYGLHWLRHDGLNPLSLRLVSSVLHLCGTGNSILSCACLDHTAAVRPAPCAS
jgi:hypothetical protein